MSVPKYDFFQVGQKCDFQNNCLHPSFPVVHAPISSVVHDTSPFSIPVLHPGHFV